MRNEEILTILLPPLLVAAILLALCGCSDDRLLEEYTVDVGDWRYECMRDYKTKEGPEYCWARWKPGTLGGREECRDTLPDEWDAKMADGDCEYAENYY